MAQTFFLCPADRASVIHIDIVLNQANHGFIGLLHELSLQRMHFVAKVVQKFPMGRHPDGNVTQNKNIITFLFLVMEWWCKLRLDMCSVRSPPAVVEASASIS